MLFRIREGMLQPCGKEERYNRQDSYIAVNCVGEADLLTGKGAQAVLLSALESNAIRFESREELDLFCFAGLTFPHHQIHLEHIHVILGLGWLQLVCEKE